MLNTKENQVLIVTATIDTNTYTSIMTYKRETSPWQEGMTWDCFWQAVEDLRTLFDNMYLKGAQWKPLDTTNSDIIDFWEFQEFDKEDMVKYPEWYYDNELEALYKEFADDIYIEPLTALHRVCGFYARHSNVIYAVDWMPIDYIF